MKELGSRQGCVGWLMSWTGLSPARKPESRGRVREAGDVGDVGDAEGEVVEVARQPAEPTYALRDDFLSPAEHSFYRVLVRAVGGEAVVCPKVNLADLLFPPVGTFRDRRVARNRIDRKHVDFVLCDPETMKPLGGVELDDVSHDRADRYERDVLVNAAFASAGLALVRVRARGGYVAMELREALEPALGPMAKPVEQGAGSAGSAGSSQDEGVRLDRTGNPVCPGCGGSMVIRQASRGMNEGGHFYGCENFPRCRRVVSLSDLV